jgi:hypothetical protein
MIRVEHMKNLKNGIVFWRIDNGQGIISEQRLRIRAKGDF